jgi:anti-anti-sigma regulatory factor
MARSEQSVFSVDTRNDPVVIAVVGRATHRNAPELKEFLVHMLDQGRRELLFDFSRCTGIDSTILGIIAAIGVDVGRRSQPGRITLARLSGRVHEVICNIGLQNLVTVLPERGEDACEVNARPTALTSQRLSEDEQARLVLEAHEQLVDLDPRNSARFQDVIDFLKNRVDPIG